MASNQRIVAHGRATGNASAYFYPRAGSRSRCWRFFATTTALVARIKVAPGYTDSIGQALQIIGADQTADVKSILTVELDAGQVVVGWTKQGMDGIEIQVDRGTGFVFLAIDTIPN